MPDDDHATVRQHDECGIEKCDDKPFSSLLAAVAQRPEEPAVVSNRTSLGTPSEDRFVAANRRNGDAATTTICEYLLDEERIRFHAEHCANRWLVSPVAKQMSMYR